LIKALLSRNFTIFGGIEAYSREDAIKNLGSLTSPGWNAKTCQYTMEYSSSMAVTALRNIDKFFGGIEVVDLQSGSAPVWQFLQSDDIRVEPTLRLDRDQHASDIS
jgi:hypothetical protein